MKKLLICLALLSVFLCSCSPTFPLINGSPTPWILGPPETPLPDVTATPDSTVVTDTTVITDTVVVTTTVITGTTTVTDNGLPNCNIKGNVAQGKIYHMPGDANYNQTKVQPERGDHYFCSAADAEAAGFRRAKR